MVETEKNVSRNVKRFFRKGRFSSKTCVGSTQGI